MDLNNRSIGVVVLSLCVLLTINNCQFVAN